MCTNAVINHGLLLTCGQVDFSNPFAPKKVFCNECLRSLKELYPQGWRHVPGDVCKHGTYVGTIYSGGDYLCHRCENGE